jgi:hypothetical protein
MIQPARGQSLPSRWSESMAKLVSCVLLAVLVMAGSSRPALAQVPGGGGEAVCEEVTGGIVSTQTGGAFPLGPASCNLGSAGASIAIQPSVLLAAQVDTGLLVAGDRSGATAIVALQYDFTLTGGRVGDLVPILVHTHMSTDVTPSEDPNNANSASAGINLFGLSGLGGNIINNGPGASACSLSPGPAGCANEFEDDLALTLASGSAERVYLHIIVAASSNSDGAASASIDPFIFVDPHFANAGDYAITVSSGVANAPPVSEVPEPSVWALVLAGFGGLGAALRRRQTGMTRSTSLSAT